MTKISLFIWLIAISSLLFSGTHVQAQTDKDKNEKELPEIAVNANPEHIRSILLRELLKDGYKLEKESDHQLTFSKEARGAKGFLAGQLFGTGGRNPLQFLSYILTQDGNQTMVTAKIEILYPDQQGQGNLRPVENKKIREQLKKNLTDLKAMAEKP